MSDLAIERIKKELSIIRGDKPVLTKREESIAILITYELSTKDIAELCKIKENSVRKYYVSIYKKLKVRDKLGVALHCLRTGIVSIEDIR